MFLRFPKEMKTKLAEKFSEIVVYGKWFVTPNLFDELTDRWGVATQTGLRQKNQETITSKYTNPETLGVDAGQEN